MWVIAVLTSSASASDNLRFLLKAFVLSDSGLEAEDANTPVCDESEKGDLWGKYRLFSLEGVCVALLPTVVSFNEEHEVIMGRRRPVQLVGSLQDSDSSDCTIEVLSHWKLAFASHWRYKASMIAFLFAFSGIRPALSPT